MYEFIFVLLSIAHGSFLAGFTGFLFWYYLPKKKEHLKSDIRWHVILISLSYFLLTLATVFTSIKDCYKWGDYWYWLVFPAYIIGDISLFSVFRYVSRRDGKEKFTKEK